MIKLKGEKMEKTNTLTLIITLVVGIILAGSLLMPVLNDATDNTIVYKNDDTYRMSPLGEQTIIVHYENSEYTVNGVTFDRNSRPITQNDTLMIFAVSHAQRSGYEYVIDENGYHRYNIGIDAVLEVTYDGANHKATVESTTSGTTYTGEYDLTSEVYYADPNGEYIWQSELGDGLYIGDDWTKFNCWSDGSNAFYSVIGDTVKVDGVEDADAVIDKVLTPIDHITGIQKLTSYSITTDETEHDCRGYIVAREVSGTTDVSLHEYSALIYVIPVIVIVALIMAAVGAIALRRAD